MTKPINEALEQALAKTKESVKADQVIPVIPAWIEALDKFDWKNIKPPLIAQMLMQIPLRSRDGYAYLKPWQAMIWAMRCYELGLSPFSGETWFNTESNKVNVTLEGKRTLARLQGFQFGPCTFERKTRVWPKVRLVVAGISEDIGYVCRLPVKGWEQPAEYLAWLSEWYMPRSPVWQEKPEHMLQVRAQEKALSFCTGVGASELPGEEDIDEEPEVQVVATEFKPI